MRLLDNAGKARYLGSESARKLQKLVDEGRIDEAKRLVDNAPVAPRRVPTPSMKSSPFGSKIEDAIPRGGVPKNWSRGEIADAIGDYELSIASRYAEQRAFDAAGIGSATERLAHARRITQEEGFLASLRKALENRK